MRTSRARSDGSRLASFHRRAGEAAGRECEARAAGLRRRLVLPLERAPAAGQRLSARQQAGERRGPRAPRPHVRTGPEQVVGYALPLRREYYTDGTSAWESGAWFFRPEQMYLIPGDSPMGLRLPLDSIPVGERVGIPAYVRAGSDGAAQPAARPRGDVEAAIRRRHARARESAGIRRASRSVPCPRSAMPAPGDASARSAAAAGRIGAVDHSHRACAPRCAAAVLRVFMPPQHYLEDYLELVAAVEDTAADLGIPVLIEGYTPPHDPRLNAIKVTPDPGVIEVNTQPVGILGRTGEEHDGLYEEARLSRLGTEKFMLDGRHTGTGGGNHIVVGGASSCRFAAAAQSRPAAQPGRLLAQPSGALVSLQRTFRRAHQPGAARRRSAQRSGLRAGNRLQAGSAGQADAAVDGRSHLPQSAGRRHRQHAPRGILHRQALFARIRIRPPRAAGNARV